MLYIFSLLSHFTQHAREIGGVLMKQAGQLHCRSQYAGSIDVPPSSMRCNHKQSLKTYPYITSSARSLVGHKQRQTACENHKQRQIACGLTTGSSSGVVCASSPNIAYACVSGRKVTSPGLDSISNSPLPGFLHLLLRCTKKGIFSIENHRKERGQNRTTPCFPCDPARRHNQGRS